MTKNNNGSEGADGTWRFGVDISGQAKGQLQTDILSKVSFLIHGQRGSPASGSSWLQNSVSKLKQMSKCNCVVIFSVHMHVRTSCELQDFSFAWVCQEIAGSKKNFPRILTYGLKVTPLLVQRSFPDKNLYKLRATTTPVALSSLTSSDLSQLWLLTMAPESSDGRDEVLLILIRESEQVSDRPIARQNCQVTPQSDGPIDMYECYFFGPDPRFLWSDFPSAVPDSLPEKPT